MPDSGYLIHEDDVPLLHASMGGFAEEFGIRPDEERKTAAAKPSADCRGPMENLFSGETGA